VHVVIAIFREKNGLTMSSRNERLTTKERATAALSIKSLTEIKDIHDQCGHNKYMG
jgi:pantothenate synthetase